MTDKMDLELLYKFFEGLTTEEEETVVRLWLEKSPENKKRLLEERKLFDRILLNTKESELLSRNKPSLFTRSQIHVYLKEFMKVAAIALIVLLGSWYYFTKVHLSTKKLVSQVITVPVGQRLNITLPDGTNVWLNSKTRIEYPVSFNDKERVVFLDGQAYFDVAKNKDLPFRVKTKAGMVEAIGTKFDVLAYSNTSQFETVLMEGKVKVNMVNDPSQSLTLTPNNKVYIQNGELNTASVDDFSPYQWKEGLICFRNESFSQIMESFEKVYDLKIVIQNPKIRNLVYTGKFRVIDGVEHALRVLQKDVNFKYQRNMENHIIKIN